MKQRKQKLHITAGMPNAGKSMFVSEHVSEYDFIITRDPEDMNWMETCIHELAYAISGDVWIDANIESTRHLRKFLSYIHQRKPLDQFDIIVHVFYMPLDMAKERNEQATVQHTEKELKYFETSARNFTSSAVFFALDDKKLAKNIQVRREKYDK